MLQMENVHAANPSGDDIWSRIIRVTHVSLDVVISDDLARNGMLNSLCQGCEEASGPSWFADV